MWCRISYWRSGRLAVSRRDLDPKGTPRKHLKTWWAEQGSNLRPQPCKGCALPTELSARAWILADLGLPVNSRKRA